MFYLKFCKKFSQRIIFNQLLDGGMLACLALAYNFFPANWLLGMTAGFFVPQIVHNAIRGQRFKFDGLYVFMLGAMRIIAPVRFYFMRNSLILYRYMCVDAQTLYSS